MQTYIIAEIGINHNGNLNTARQLIHVAENAGCDAVKFQKRNPEICVPEHQKGVMRDTPWGRMTYLDYKHKIEFDKIEYDGIDRYCEDLIDWSASPWDLDSLEFVTQYNVPWIKIPSAMLTNQELVTEATKWCYKNSRDIILSTGMSTQKEIHNAYCWVCNHSSAEWMRNYLVLMHCNSSYPTPIKELNLRRIKTLADHYPCKVGYSGHEFGEHTTIAAVYLGATYIERHITLDRSMWGTDQLASLGPKDLTTVVKGIRELEEAYGNGRIEITKSEIPIRKKLRG